MDYEKKYKEALERARQFSEHPLQEDSSNIVEYIFPELRESENERTRKEIISFLQLPHKQFVGERKQEKWIAWLEKQGEPQDKGEISDGYHTFNELYYYRMLYNAAFFNMLPKEWVHKSKKHHDGEDCFGGGWFIVMANLPTGQISNHYELKDWDLFQIPEKEVADKWDGHTPQEAADRLHKYLLEKQDKQPSAIRWYDVSLIPQEMEELLVEWDSEDATWHEIAFYHADTKTFWNGTRQVENVTRWCYITDLLEKQGEQKLPIEKLPSEMKTIEESLGFTTQEECDEYNQMVSDLIMCDDDKGEQKTALSEEELTDFEKSLKHVMEETLECGDIHNLKADADLLLRLVKPTDEDMKEALRTEYEKGRADAFAQMQKEWSKEDEKMVKCCKIALEAFEKLGKNTQGFPHENYFELDEEKIYPSEVNRWLKFLSPQPKQEWSEEDDMMIKETLYFLREYQQSNRCKYEHNMQNSVSCEKWLKSLKERYTWKPSGEQMLAINTAINVLGKGTINGKYLIELQEQLKKLREE